MSRSSRSHKEEKRKMKPPEKGGKPKTIHSKMKSSPGGPHTPGEKAKRRK